MSNNERRQRPGGPDVLVVDDEEDIRELLEMTLIRMGLGDGLVHRGPDIGGDFPQGLFNQTQSQHQAVHADPGVGVGGDVRRPSDEGFLRDAFEDGGDGLEFLTVPRVRPVPPPVRSAVRRPAHARRSWR